MSDQPNLLAEDAFVVAKAKTPLGKRMLWVPDGTGEQAWKDEQNDEGGEWIKKALPFSTWFEFFHFQPLNDDARFNIRALLDSQSNSAQIIGCLNPATFDGNMVKLQPPKEHVGSYELWASKLKKQRTQKTLIDAPRTSFIVDFDALPLGLDVIEHDDELADIFVDVLDDADLDWLITSFDIHLSSSHGYIDSKIMRAHVEWRLQYPMSIAEQKHLATYINAQLAKAGRGPECCDLSIYESSRLLFTAEPETVKEVYVLGTGRVTVPKRPIRLQRHKRIRNALGVVRRNDIPQEAFAAVGKAKAKRKVQKITGVAPPPTDTDSLTLSPGNIYRVIRARIMREANRTPHDQMIEARERLRKQLEDELVALPDHAENMHRMGYVNEHEFKRSWDGAMLRRRTWEPTEIDDDRVHRPGVDVHHARKALQIKVEEKVREGIAFAQRDTADDGYIIKKGRHVLVKVPPGVGKTEAVVASIKHSQLMANRISYLSPTQRLSEEATERLRARSAKDEFTQSRIRHHLGRKALCKEPSYGKLADAVERQGVSPLKLVCSKCPIRDACKWPVQQEDSNSGFVSGQHQHATTSLARIQNLSAPNAPDVMVIDESMLSTLVAEHRKGRKITTLKKWSQQSTVMTKVKDRWVDGPTADLRAYRTMALDTIQDGDRIRMASIIAFRAIEGNGNWRIDNAINMEREVHKNYSHMLYEAVEEYHEAFAKKKGIRKAQRKISVAAGQLQISGWFSDFFACIKGSMGVEGRQHVFGVRISPSKYVSLHRRRELPKVMEDRDVIWLDGTAEESVWQAMLGNQGITTSVIDLHIAPGLYELTQFVDKPYSKRFFLRNDSEAADARSNLAKLHRYILGLERTYGSVLVVTQKEVRTKIEALGVPDTVALEHFNNLRGIDQYRKTPCIVIVGRPQPPQSTLEVMTEALHYDNPEVGELVNVTGYYQRERTLPLHDNNHGIKFKAESHPDDRVEQMRRQIVDAEVRQALHRLRLFDRTEDNKAHIFVFGQIDTGLTISHVRDWVDAKVEQASQLERDGILPPASHEWATLIADGAFASLSPKRRREIWQKFDKDWPEWLVTTDQSARSIRVLVKPDTAQTEREIVELLSSKFECTVNSARRN